MRILVIDGQGGRIGRQLIEAVIERYPDLHITAVGTNSTATASMLKGGAHEAATGENAVKVACRKAGVIIGPVGIVIADALVGEVSPAMALAVAQADAVRILIPMNRCDNIVAGIGNMSASSLIEDAVSKLGQLIEQQ
ncbi:MAG: DUF3842 family protein [Ruminococcaceae bacterium]|nr:DUF3842 family protein [Oscillospiraceae bacterium]